MIIIIRRSIHTIIGCVSDARPSGRPLPVAAIRGCSVPVIGKESYY